MSAPDAPCHLHAIHYTKTLMWCDITQRHITEFLLFTWGGGGGDGGLEINTRLLLLHNTGWVYSQPYQLYTPSTNTCTNIYMLHVSDVIVHHRSRDQGSITGTSLDSSARLAILASPYIMPLMNLSHLHRFKIPSAPKGIITTGLCFTFRYIEVSLASPRIATQMSWVQVITCRSNL